MPDGVIPGDKKAPGPDRKGLLVVVSAPSGAGKTTLCRRMADTVSGLQYSISYTTRARRPGETDGKDYFFIRESEFMERVRRHEFAEWAKVHGHLYGTHVGFLDRTLAAGTDVLLDVDTQGASALKKVYPDGIFIFVLPPSMEILMERLRRRRSDSSEEIERRLRVAREEIRHFVKYDYVLVNDDIGKAIRELESVILAERMRVRTLDPEWIRRRYL